MKRKRILAALMAFAMILAVPGFTGSVSAVDLTQPCSLTVNPGGPELAEDLADANVVIDLYQVAACHANTLSDGYTFQTMSPYESLEVTADMTDDEWTDFADSAAEIALKSGTPVVTGAAAGSAITQLDSGVDLGAGLYLVIAHGADITDYETIQDEDGNDILVTKAYSSEYQYSFRPEMVALPGKEVAEEEGASVTWLNDVTITLKPDQGPRYGSLRIVKSFLAFLPNYGAQTCVFSVEAELKGKVVFSNVYSLTFESAGEQYILVDRIPVGATVTVSEVYSGRGYQLVGENDQKLTISATETLDVDFYNLPYEVLPPIGGGGIENQFAYDPDNDEGWTWTPSDPF